MIVRIWGTRGSIPAPRPATAGYGGNTSCIEVRGEDPGELVVLDAGTGICALGSAGLSPEVSRVDVLLTHLHMDHILGLGFFSGLFQTGLEVHLWGPASPVHSLRDRLSRYLSPPLVPCPYPGTAVPADPTRCSPRNLRNPGFLDPSGPRVPPGTDRRVPS